MKGLLTKLIGSVFSFLASIGSDWAKKKLNEKYNSGIKPEMKRKKRLRKKLLNIMKPHKPGRPYSLSISAYGRRVEKLLSFVRDHLCDGSDICVLIGTSTILPSEIIGIALYRTTWISHGQNVKKLADNGEYKAFRVVCVPHENLGNDVKANTAAYDDFLKWCEGSLIEPRVFNGDYQVEMKKNQIELQDYMLFGDVFVFGSKNSITEAKIESYLIVDDDELYKYKLMAQAVLANSTIIKDVTSLNQYIDAKIRV
jgi:hypothetical protein